MGNGPAIEPYRMRRGNDKVNPIQQSFRALKIRLVYPPFKSSSSTDMPFYITDRPAAFMQYLLKAGGKEYRNKTNEHGIMLELLPSNVESANLTLFVKETQDVFWQLDLVIGDLDGCAGPVGAEARLNNLGLHASAAVDLSEDFNQVLQGNHDPYFRARDRFVAVFGCTEDPNSISYEKAVWQRIKEVHGG